MPQRIIQPGIVHRMEPRELLQRLMDKRGYNPNSLARATKDRTKQPQIHRFLKGEAREPKRSTLLPVAEVLGVPVDAFFDPKYAEAVWREIEMYQVIDSEQLKAQESRPTHAGSFNQSQPPDDPIEQLAALLRSHSSTRRQTLSELLSRFALNPDDRELQNELTFLLKQTPAKSGDAAPAPRKLQRAG